MQKYVLSLTHSICKSVRQLARIQNDHLVICMQINDLCVCKAKTDAQLPHKKVCKLYRSQTTVYQNVTVMKMRKEHGMIQML